MWRRPSRRTDDPRPSQDSVAPVMMVLRPPVEGLLTRALRRVARRRPEVLARLGAFQSAAFLISPSEAPVAFRLEPAGVRGRGFVVRRGDAGPFAAIVRGDRKSQRLNS